MVARPRVAKAAALGLAVALLTAACGQDAELKSAGTSVASAVPTTGASSCTASPSTARLPSSWPDLPLLPPDFVLGSVQARSDHRTVVAGVVPHDVKQVLSSLRETYAKAGVKLDHGEVEPHDAESDFEGKGIKGRWAIRQVPGCTSSTTLSVVVQPTS